MTQHILTIDDDALIRRSLVYLLEQAGYRVTAIDVGRDIPTVLSALDPRPDVVFNLVESLGGTDRLMPLATLLLESLSTVDPDARLDLLHRAEQLLAEEYVSVPLFQSSTVLVARSDVVAPDYVGRVGGPLLALSGWGFVGE